MIKRITIWICICFLAGLFSVTQKPCFATRTLSNEQYIVALVNHIRLDPFGYAEMLGYNRETLLQTLPWLAPVSAGLELSIASDFLNQRASALNSDDSLVQEPVPTIGTDFARTGHIGGVVSFLNFMDPWLAINVIMDNQFKKELDQNYEGKRYILSRAYRHVGAAFRAGRVGISNAYYISICFGSDLLKSEAQVVNLINQMRANPLESYIYLNLNTSFLPGNFAPLFLNDALRSTASVGLSSHVDFPAHALYFGFTGSGVVESSVIEAFPNIDPNFYALLIFSSLIINDAQFYPFKNTIFNPAYNEIGPAVFYVDGETYDYSKLTVATGYTGNQNPAASKIFGLAYTDFDQNNVYTPGEDAANRVITIYNKLNHAKVAIAITSNAGQFTASLPINMEYIIQTGTVDNLSRKDIFLTTDLFVDLKVN